MKSILVILMVALTLLVNAQGVGINTTVPDGSSILDVSASDKGILIPRVALTSTTDVTTITNGNVVSLLVFNTATIADIVPGYYYWDGMTWKALETDADADPNNEIELPAGGTTGQVLTTDGSGNYSWVTESSGTDDQNIQGLAFDPTTNMLTVGVENGTPQTVDLTPLLELPPTATTGQLLTWNGTSWVAQNAVSNADDWGNDVVNTTGSNLSGNGTPASPLSLTEVDGSITNEIQDLSLTGTTLSLTNDATTVDLTSLQDQDWYEVGGTIQSDDINDNIYTHGNVGIGTATPSRDLVIGDNAIQLSSANNVGTTADILFRQSAMLTAGTSMLFNIDATNTSDFQFFGFNKDAEGTVGNTELMRIQENGHVGIGTTSPTYKLQVEENKDGQIGVAIWNPDNTGTNATEILLVGQATGNKYGYLGHVNDGYSNVTYPNVTPNMTILYGGGDLGITAGSILNDITFGSNLLDNRNMIIKGGTGNVGIGTTTPNAKLEVAGTANIQRLKNNVTPHTSPALQNYIEYVDVNDEVYSWIGDGSSGKNFNMTAYYDYNIHISTHSSNTNTSRTGTLFMDGPTGNVGINTKVPSERLEVQGTVKIVDGTEGVGKVFTSDAAGKGSWQLPVGSWTGVLRAGNLPITTTLGFYKVDFTSAIKIPAVGGGSVNEATDNITVPTTGMYEYVISGWANSTTRGGTPRESVYLNYWRINVNGVSTQSPHYPGSTGWGTNSSISGYLDLTAGDVVELQQNYSDADYSNQCGGMVFSLKLIQ